MIKIGDSVGIGRRGRDAGAVTEGRRFLGKRGFAYGLSREKG